MEVWKIDLPIAIPYTGWILSSIFLLSSSSAIFRVVVLQFVIPPTCWQRVKYNSICDKRRNVRLDIFFNQ